jgi:transketolase
VWLRVVSMPCMDLFEEQSAEYKRSVFPAGAPVMSIEPASVDSWRRYAHAPFGECTVCVLHNWLDAGCPFVEGCPFRD